ncbi:fungal specific transcription factor [Colletotrichum tabaci]|uniref:Fungal specific transcription factor n=1 Tax=Colletotrichum tabaci TaxID=1209068 RepID=A0AAV9TMM7_9PEZI
MDTDGVVSPGGEPSRREEGRIDDDEGIVSQLSVGVYGRSYLVAITDMYGAFSVTVAAIASERKIDLIAKKLEDFGQMLGQMESRPQPSTRPSPSSTWTPSSLKPSPEAQSAAEKVSPQAGKSKIVTPKVEYEGETSLLAQAAFANRFLHEVVSNRHSTDITGEMVSVLGTLGRALGRQKDQNDTEYLYPNARTLEPGSSVRDLPMPPVEVVFVCLRMAKEHPRVKAFWNHDAMTFAPFTEFFLKVYSPGDATHADLIIVYAGLYWLFTECMKATQDAGTKLNYQAHAFTCRDNLETVLSNLPFHLPSTIETTCAMFLAALYCLENCQPSAAWNFIATASHMTQTLGCHSIAAIAHEAPQNKYGKIKIFWLIYVIEKGLSLRLGRSSTIRDNEVTVPRPQADTHGYSDPTLMCLFPECTRLATLQGMVYDQIYSPASLCQPQEDRHTEKLAEVIGGPLFEAMARTDKVNQLALSCLIYRAVPPEAGEKTVFGKDCIRTARQALEEHKRCMYVVAGLEERFLESYLNWTLLSSPFIPFVVMFCHVVETCNQGDLDLLSDLVATLRSTTAETFSPAIKKELRLFSALYDVACSYMKLKADSSSQPQPASGGPVDHWSLTAGSAQPPPALLQEAATPSGMASLPTETAAMGGGFSINDPQTVPEWGPFTLPGDLTMEVDEQGSQLGNWLYVNNQMIRALENNYF